MGSWSWPATVFWEGQGTLLRGSDVKAGCGVCIVKFQVDMRGRISDERMWDVGACQGMCMKMHMCVKNAHLNMDVREYTSRLDLRSLFHAAQPCVCCPILVFSCGKSIRIRIVRVISLILIQSQFHWQILLIFDFIMQLCSRPQWEKIAIGKSRCLLEQSNSWTYYFCILISSH